MKYALILSTMALALNLSAQEVDKYTKVMTSTLAKIDTAESLVTWVKSANKFERIATAEKSKWLPYYWSGYCHTISAFQEEDKDKKEQYLKKADGLISKADSLKPKNSEIYSMRALWYSGKMMVEGMAGAMKYGPLSSSTLDSAMLLNPKNPRAFHLKGTGVAYTPPMFGGGKDKALPILEEAMKKYDAFEPRTPLHPDWGREMCEKMIEYCKSEDK